MPNRKPRPAKSNLADGQKCVWDYPRPPALVKVGDRVRVVFAGHTIADSTKALRILETSHPPTIYIPPQDVTTEILRPSSLQTFCEWKGVANYYHLIQDEQHVKDAAWYYSKPHATYAELTGFISFYPSRVSECYVGEELVRAQAGDFYGGWITSKIVGPFKGEAGTSHW